MTPAGEFTLRQAGGSAAWRGSDIRDRPYIYDLTSSEIRELDTKFRYIVSQGLDPAKSRRGQFPLEELRSTVEAITRELDSGIGFGVIRGIPIERYSVRQAGVLVCILGASFGRLMPQNSKGEVLNHVRDSGLATAQQGARTRGYQGTGALPFHSDSCDIVGLLCIRAAESGGVSALASSLAVHNEMLKKRPDLLSLLYQPLYIDRHGENTQGAPPYYSTPVFMWHHGRLFSRFNPGYVYSAQRFPETPRLTEPQMEAIEMFNRICACDRFRLDMKLRPGDLQLLNNNVIVHARSAFHDSADVAKKRHLLRLWLFTSAINAIPVPMRDRYRDMEAWQDKMHLPRAPQCD